MTNGNRKTILLVEDEALIAMMEKIELEKYGYIVHHVTTGEKAVQTIIENTQPIDLILMDIDLGSGIDGTQAAEKILKEKNIPIVFLSSHTEPEIVEKTEKNTSYGYMVKNSGIVVLDASIKMAFRLFDSYQLADDSFRYSINGICVHRMLYNEVGEPFDCEYLKMNDAFAKHTGVPLQTFVGKTFWELYPSEQTRELINLYAEVVFSGKPIHHELYFAQMGGWFEFLAYPTQNNEFTVVVNNITERKRAENALRESEEKFRKAFENHSAVKLIIDPTDGSIVDANISAAEFYGWTLTQLRQIKIQEINTLSPDAVKKEMILAKEHKKNHFNFRHKLKNGFIKDVEVFSTGFKSQGKELLHSIIHDVTEKKRAEKDLKIKDNAIETSINAIAFADIQGVLSYVNESFIKMWGFDKKEEVIGQLAVDFWESTAEASEIIENLYKNSSCKSELKAKKKNNELFDVLLSASLIKDDNGNPICMMASFEEITVRKQAEQALKESEEKFKGIFEYANAGIAIAGYSTLTDVNKEFKKILGYSKAELLNMTFKDFTHPDDLNNENELIEKLLKGEIDNYRIEKRYIHKNGALIWVDLSIAAMKDEKGDISHFIGMVKDITDRKRTDEIIKQQFAEKETLLKEVHHRIKNNIASIEGFLTLQATSTDKTDVKTALRESISRIQSTRVLYEKLLISKEYQDVSIKNYIDSIIDSLVAVFPESKNVSIERDLMDFTLSSKKAMPMGIIINELMTNIFKYAFKEMEKSYILIEVNKTKNNVTLKIKDNGIGIDERVDSIKSPGFGLTIVEMLAEQLNGTFSMANDNGTRSVLKFEI